MRLGINFFPTWVILKKRVSRDLLRNNSQIANERKAITMNVLRHLPTREAVTIKKRTSKSNSTWEKVDSRSYLR